ILDEWAADPRCSVSKDVIRSRIRLKDWTPEELISRPLIPRARRNKRTITITAFSEEKLLSEWAADPRCMVTSEGLRSRINAGVAPETAITRRIGKQLIAYGESKTAKQCARDSRCCVSARLIKSRMHSRNWTPEEIISKPCKEAVE